VFIQLLSAASGRMPADLPPDYVRCQYELAQELNLPILQWRDPDVKLADVADDRHRELLQLATVRGDIGIEGLKKDLQTEIIKRLPQRKNPPAPQSSGKFAPVNVGVKAQEGKLVLVSPDVNDTRLTEWIHQVLEKEDIDYIEAYASYQGPAVRSTTMEEWFMECHGLILTYGQRDSSCFNRTLQNVRKIAWKRADQPIPAYVVYDTSLDEKELVTAKIRGLRQLEYGSYPDEQKLRKFISTILNS